MTSLYQLITEPAQLSDFCRQISDCSWLAVDTEFVRKDTYFPNIGLIQIYAENDLAALIDPVALSDLSELWALFQNENIVKVFHAARQDLEVLYFASGALPSPIFDTQIAGIFFQLGVSAGLGTALERVLNISLPKDQTRTDWVKRPLNPKQLQYAFDDVYYLAKLFRTFQTELTSEQLAILKEDFNALLSPELYTLNPEVAGNKIKPLHTLSPKQRAIGMRMAEWREAYAIDHDKPRRWTLGDDAIVAIAKRPPKDAKALFKVPGLPAASIKQFADEWITLIDDVFAHPDTWPPKVKRPSAPTPSEETYVLLGQTLANQVGNEYNIPVSQIANRVQILEMVRHPHDTHFLGWRKHLFERNLLALLSQKSCLCPIDGGVQVQPKLS